MVITEALAELKTLGKRIAKKQAFVQQYTCRQTHMVDPFVKDGGTAEVLRREMQAIADLEERVIAIRRAIAHANAVTTITIGDDARSIADWLVFRKEIAVSRQKFVANLLQVVHTTRQQAQQKGLQTVADEREAKQLGDVVVNLDEIGLNRAAERLEEILGTLDGLLSLKNATVEVTP